MDICQAVFATIRVALARFCLCIRLWLKKGENNMRSTVSSDHPKEQLLFFVAQDVSDPVRAQVRDFILNLASMRRWLNGPLQFVNECEEPADASRGDLPIETLGGYLDIYSA